MTSVASLLLLAGCGGGGGGGGDTTGPGSDRTENLPSGGEIVFPEGSLPEGTGVTIEPAATPTLPPGIDPVGDAVAIALDGVLTRPARLSVPIPAGTDPADFVLVQVEDDGTPILLGGEVVGNEYVATTPGFGTSSIVRKALRVESNRGRIVGGVREVFLPGQDTPPGLTAPVPRSVAGPRQIPQLEAAFYNVDPVVLAADASQIEWDVKGPGETAPMDDPSYIALSGLSVGSVDLLVDYLDPASGVRGFASATITIEEEGDLPLDQMFVSVPSSPVANRPFQSQAIVGRFDVVRWTWDFGDGRPGSTGEQGAQGVSVEVTHTYVEPGTYTITFNAFDAADNRLSSSTDRTVLPIAPLNVKRGSFPSEVAFGATADYSAVIQDGSPAYAVTWTRYPGGALPTDTTPNVVVTKSIGFDEPGTHYVTVSVTDAEDRTDFYTGQTTVTGADPLQVTLDLPPTTGVAVGSPVTGSLSVVGGILVANGERKNYTVDVDWGNGVERFELASSHPNAGVTRAISRAYNDAGEYQVMAKVIDGAGAQATTAMVPIEVVQNEVLLQKDFVLIQGDSGCSYSAAPLTTGTVTLRLDRMTNMITVGFEGSGSGTRAGLSCLPTLSSGDLTWSSQYDTDDEPAVGPFALEGDVASFAVSGKLSGEGSFSWSNCFDGDDDPTDCPLSGGGPYEFNVTFVGTANLATGSSSGNILVQVGLSTSGTWGD